MLATLSSNVVLAKARTMYGRRLTAENYKDLLKCKTVMEVASYLKSRTSYGRVLAGIEETEIHRGQLESKLRLKLTEDFASLCRYEITVGERFAEYFIRRSEITHIMQAILFLNAGEAYRSGEDPWMVPAFLHRRSHLNFSALEKATNFDELLEALARSPYQKILEPFRPAENQRVDYTGVEIALYSFLFDGIFEIIEKYTKGETKKQLLDIFNSFVDLTNFVRIVRLRVFYHIDAEKVEKSLLPFGNLNQRILSSMADAGTEEEIQERMSHTDIGLRAARVQHETADELPRRFNFKACHHYIDFSTHPSVVLISYVFLCEAEISDIVTIVEGIRYQLPPHEIQKMLTIMNFGEGRD